MLRALLCSALALAFGAEAQTLIENINGYAWDGPALRRFDALAVDAQGRVSDPEALDGERVAHIDGRGATLLPGLIDAHGHIRGLGRLRTEVDLAGVRSLAEALEHIRRHAEANPDRAWVLGRGWNQELWSPARFPTAADLDGVVADRPVWLDRVDGHAGWANSRAMQLAGVDAGSEAPPGGIIIRDEQGRPSGVFVDAAESLVRHAIPVPGADDDRRALRAAFEELIALGLTSVHDAGVDARTLELYRELDASGELPLRLYVMLDPATADALGDAPPARGERLFVGAVKLYVDGALGSRGAALLAPYRDAEHNGLLMYDGDELARLIRRYDAAGYRVAVHAIGDRGNRVTLDAFAAAGVGGRRHRIEHAQVVALADIPRFAELGLIASMQPIHATSDMAMAERRLTREPLRGAYAWRRMLDAGVIIAAGSDFPVEPANPFYGLHAAVMRTDREGAPSGGWRVDQAMTVTEALRAYTRDAAFAAGLEDRQGTLAPGSWADFVLVDADPLAVPGPSLWRIQVMQTWVAGQPVFTRPLPARR